MSDAITPDAVSTPAPGAPNIMDQLQQFMDIDPEEMRREHLKRVRAKSMVVLAAGIIGFPLAAVAAWVASGLLLSGLGFVAVGWFAHLCVWFPFWVGFSGFLGRILAVFATS